MSNLARLEKSKKYMRYNYPLEKLYSNPSRVNPCLLYIYEKLDEISGLLKMALDIEEE